MISPRHPNQMNMPRLEAQFITPDGTLAQPWYRMLVQLFKLSGASSISLTDGVYLVLSAPEHIDAYGAIDNEYIATLALKNIPGPAPTPVTPDAPGFVFSPETDGTLQVYGAMVELKRAAGGGDFIPVTLTGGSFPLLVGDSARITWTTDTPPLVEFWGAS